MPTIQMFGNIIGISPYYFVVIPLTNLEDVLHVDRKDNLFPFGLHNMYGETRIKGKSLGEPT